MDRKISEEIHNGRRTARQRDPQDKRGRDDACYLSEELDWT